MNASACGLLIVAGGVAPVSAALSDREVRCLALIAYTEAAVVRVVRSRIADPRFPEDACAVIAQVGQFQPIAQSELLRGMVRDPEGYSIPQVLGLRTARSRALLAAAHRLARAARSCVSTWDRGGSLGSFVPCAAIRSCGMRR